MQRRRLAVVAPLPPVAGSRVDGVSTALGDPSLADLGPHLTLVPPVNVRDDAIAEVCSVVRDLASRSPVTTSIGPIVTFAPANPVLYLEVAEVALIREVRDAVFRPPLSRPLSHEFVPHITVNPRASDAQIEHVPRLTAFADVVTFDRVEVLEEHTGDNGRQWLPVEDVLLGSEFVVGRGGLETTLVSSTRQQLSSALDVGTVRSDVIVSAWRHDSPVGVAALGNDGSRAELIWLEVASQHRGTGVGRALVSRVREIARGENRRLVPSSALGSALAEFVDMAGP